MASALRSAPGLKSKTDTAFEVKEAALGHAVDSGIVGAYQRSDRLEKRRKLMQKWEQFVVRLVRVIKGAVQGVVRAIGWGHSSRRWQSLCCQAQRHPSGR